MVKMCPQSPTAGYQVNREAPQDNTSVHLKFRALLPVLTSFLQLIRIIFLQRTRRLKLQPTIA